ncbi:MAG: type I restriction endonuclease subunit R [Blastocatellia bacterium]
MPTDTSEKGLESLIVADMIVGGWLAGDAKDYDRDNCIDLVHLRAFLEATQPKLAAVLELSQDTPARRAFLARLEKEIGKRGVIDVLRRGVKHGPHELTLFYGAPSPGNDKAAALHARNRFSVTRQLKYSRDETRRALDLCLFVNGLPVATFELKNSLTKQTVEDAIEQYRRDRDPRERLFAFGRCVVHFAVDDSEVRMCTELKGKASWFLPLNQGWNDGAGNPPNPYGLKTDYLWKRLLTPPSLTDILENYAQIVEETNKKTGKKRPKQVFPRYHQLDVVRRLLADVAANGAGKRYLIQHSAGSGKSNSIAWLAHQLFTCKAVVVNNKVEFRGPAVDGKIPHRPFHSYTMKQAIEERFILDVLKSYTPVTSFYKLIKTVESDPEFDTRKARKKLRKYVESHNHAIRIKAEIMVDHFQEHVLALNKIGGQARAMVVTSGIERAIQYFHAIRDYLRECKSQDQAIVAFSGEHEYGGAKVTEASLNGFPTSEIADRIQEDPYRFLICAEKFQTGYDEPLLHTMYVDKPLSGIKAVQTLSRLNRAHPQKHDVFVLDFLNDSDTIQKAFSDYYRTTILSEETDPNKLHDLKGELDGYHVYAPEQIETLVTRYLDGASREQLDPILDACVAVYQQLDEDGQVDFKGKAKTFTRTYDFLASILPYTNAEWEKLSIFLNFLIPKLPAPKEEDLSRGILEVIDMDSYRAEKKAAMKIALADEDAEIGPVPMSGGGRKSELELDRLSNILKNFNDQFSTLFTDADRVVRRIREDIAPKVAADQAYRNAKKNTPNAAGIELEAALKRVVTPLYKDDTEFFKQFVQNESFKRFVTDMVLTLTSAEIDSSKPAET